MNKWSKSDAENWLASQQKVVAGIKLTREGTIELITEALANDVHKSLGMTPQDLVELLGGPISYVTEERKLLAKTNEDKGLSQRENAAALGVAQSTVHDDLASDRNRSEISNSSEETDRNRSEIKPQTFNQVNDNIGWAKWSWNPVTGCLHNCDYCYARDIANRFYAEKFEPTFHADRLDAPANTKLPKDVGSDPAWRRVFTCSMADLFGKWVPQKWIKPIFKQIEEHQEWEFLCLTKFPQRLAEIEWPPNVWAGTTVDLQSRVENAERSFSGVKAGVKWLSCEPLLEPLKFKNLAMFDWVVIGASTGSSLAKPFAPPFEWVANLYLQAKEYGCKVYLKHNLFGEGGRSPGMQSIREWPR